MAEHEDAKKQVKPSMLEVARAQVAYDLSLRGHHPIAMAEEGRADRVMGTKTRMPDLLCSDCGLRIDVRPKSRMMMALSHNPQDPERAWDAQRRGPDLVAFLKCELVDGHYAAGDAVQYATVAALQAAPGQLRESHFPGPEGNRHYLNWNSMAPSGAGVVKAVDAEGIHWVRADLAEFTVKLPAGHVAYVKPGDLFAAGERLFHGVTPPPADVVCGLEKAWDALSALKGSEPLDRYAAVRAVAERVRTRIAGLEADYRFEAERVGAEKAAAEGWRAALGEEQRLTLEAQERGVVAEAADALERVWTAPEERFQVRLEALLELCRLAPGRYVGRLASQIDRVRVPALKAEIVSALGELRGAPGVAPDPAEIAVKALAAVARSGGRYSEELRALAVQALGAQGRGDLVEPFRNHSSLTIKKAAMLGLEEAIRRGWKLPTAGSGTAVGLAETGVGEPAETGREIST